MLRAPGSPPSWPTLCGRRHRRDDRRVRVAVPRNGAWKRRSGAPTSSDCVAHLTTDHRGGTPGREDAVDLSGLRQFGIPRSSVSAMVGEHRRNARGNPSAALAAIRLVRRSCGLELLHNDQRLASRFPQRWCQNPGGRGGERGINILNPNSFASKLGGLMRWVWFRVAAAIVASSGVVAGLLVNINRATREGQDRGDVLANYFSLFTIVSSILSVVVLMIAARWILRHTGPRPSRSASPWRSPRSLGR